MVCSCCAADRAQHGPHWRPMCSRASRRLEEAGETVDNLRVNFLNKPVTLTPADVEGDEVLCVAIGHACRTASEQVHLKFNYLHNVPALFVHANKPDGARRIIEEIDKYPAAFHEELTLWWQANLRRDLETVAAGGSVSAALEKERRRLCNSPMVESPGETYHRGTNYDKLRAAGIGRARLIAAQRVKQNLVWPKLWQAKYGDRAKRCIDYE